MCGVTLCRLFPLTLMLLWKHVFPCMKNDVLKRIVKRVFRVENLSCILITISSYLGIMSNIHNNIIICHLWLIIVEYDIDIFLNYTVVLTFVGSLLSIICVKLYVERMVEPLIIHVVHFATSLIELFDERISRVEIYPQLVYHSFKNVNIAPRISLFLEYLEFLFVNISLIFVIDKVQFDPTVYPSLWRFYKLIRNHVIYFAFDLQLNVINALIYFFL